MRGPGRDANVRITMAHVSIIRAFSQAFVRYRLDGKLRELDEQLIKHRDAIKRCKPGPAQEAAKRRALNVSAPANVLSFVDSAFVSWHPFSLTILSLSQYLLPTTCYTYSLLSLNPLFLLQELL